MTPRESETAFIPASFPGVSFMVSSSEFALIVNAELDALQTAESYRLARKAKRKAAASR